MVHDLTLHEIIETFGIDSAKPKLTPVPREIVRRWMKNNDIEVLGAIYAFILNPIYYSRIDPALTFEDYSHFVKCYLERCLREDPSGNWANSRYSAGWDIVNWFNKLWNDQKVPRCALMDLKQLLEHLYKSGDKELRTCIITATLEHLFEKAAIKKYFADWQKDPILRDAYSEALEWQNLAKHRGRV